jgi:hypothetical protein
MNAILEFVINNPETVSILLTALGGSSLAGLITAFTKTRQTLWYKALEVVALNIFKAKDK